MRQEKLPSTSSTHYKHKERVNSSQQHSVPTCTTPVPLLSLHSDNNKLFLMPASSSGTEGGVSSEDGVKIKNSIPTPTHEQVNSSGGEPAKEKHHYIPANNTMRLPLSFPPATTASSSTVRCSSSSCLLWCCGVVVLPPTS